MKDLILSLRQNNIERAQNLRHDKTSISVYDLPPLTEEEKIIYKKEIAEFKAGVRRSKLEYIEYLKSCIEELTNEIKDEDGGIENHSWITTSISYIND